MKGLASFPSSLIAAAFVLMLLFPSCWKKDSERFYSQALRHQTDSIVKTIKDYEALNDYIDISLKEDNLYGVMISYAAQGKILRDKGAFHEAVNKHQRSLTYGEMIEDTLGIIAANNNIGTDYRRIGDLDIAAEFHYRALLLCDRFGDKSSYQARKSRVNSLNGIGNIALSLGNYFLADSCFRQALAGERELGSALGQAINYANLGSIFEHSGQMDSALVYYRLAMEYDTEAGSELGVGLCHTYFGSVYEKLGRRDEAVSEYLKAYDILEKTGDRWHWLEPCLSLCEIYLSSGDFGKADKYISMAKDAAEEILSLEHLARVYGLESRLCEKKGDARNALENYRLSVQYTDSVNNINTLNAIQNERAKFQMTRYQDQLASTQERLQKENLWRRIFLFGVIALLALLIALVFISRYAILQRTKNMEMIQEMDNSRSAFFTNVTHAFRTPLTVILGVSRQLQESSLPKGESVSEAGTMITRQGDRLLRLVNQLLDISKVNSRVGADDWRHGNVVSFIEMIVNSFHAKAESNDISLSFSSSGSSIEMDFIPEYLRKVIENMIQCSLNNTDPHGRVEVGATGDDKSLILSFKDNGRGIPKEVLPHIFEEFYRFSSRSSDMFTGVGLSLVHQIVTILGGTIDCDSEPGAGTRFMIRLPLENKNVEAAPFSEGEIPAASGNLSFVSENHPFGEETGAAVEDVRVPEVPTLLIVEDEKDISHYIGSLMKDRYEIRYADNGLKGLEIARDLVPDIIITDLMMPEMDGLEMVRRIRSSEVLNHIPIIAITAKSTEKDKIMGIEAGADVYIYKPFNPDELNAQVSRLLQSRKTLREKYMFGILSGKADVPKAYSDMDQTFINKFVDVIYSKMSEMDVDKDAIAGEMKMTREQLNRKIQALTGESASTYIMQIRLYKARTLLESRQDLQIADIATKCGFEYGSYFSKAFKQLFGMTPQQYRRQHNYQTHK